VIDEARHLPASGLREGLKWSQLVLRCLVAGAHSGIHGNATGRASRHSQLAGLHFNRPALPPRPEKPQNRLQDVHPVCPNNHRYQDDLGHSQPSSSVGSLRQIVTPSDRAIREPASVQPARTVSSSAGRPASRLLGLPHKGPDPARPPPARLSQHPRY